jgi:acyl-CoA synthetase (AMP-forming)/AMP-acid ligase II/acyl carrier protein
MQCRTRNRASCQSTHRSLVEMLHERVWAMGEKQVFSFLDGGEEAARLTYRSLDERAKAIAAELQASAPAGERAILLFPPGLGFVTAFFGCLYAGIISVPAAIPGRNRLTASVEAVLEGAKASLVLSTADHLERAQQSYARQTALAELPWIAVDRISAVRQHDWQDPHVEGGQTAFLQFTSGSTSSPKGVVLSHGQLLQHAALIQSAFQTTEESHAVFWLPLYHDMGLIGGVIEPVFCGGSATFMAPAAFLQRPALWLETISRTRATISGGPDFAYDLCARKITAEDRAGLDLSRWELAFVGAERIRPKTIEHFSETFASCGFRREAFFPCYGLAEATLMVSGGPLRAPPLIVRLNAEALACNQVELSDDQDESCLVLVGCGERLDRQRLLIVDPGTCLAACDGNVGEIWVAGPSVADEYYENPQATAETFQGRLADTGEGPFLRTGDLGFIHGGQLFVTGRLKNLIVIRGRNHYPEDIEQTTQSAYQGLRPDCGAAFSVESEDGDVMVVVQEIEPRRLHGMERLGDLDRDPAIQAVRKAIAVRHELEVHAIVLVKAGAVPKTSSGKIRRAACREQYLKGELEIVASWKASDGSETARDDVSANCQPPPRSAEEIEAWLMDRISARLRLAPSDVQVTTPFLELGMGSLDATEIAAALERWTGRHLSPTAIYNYPTIALLARWLVTPIRPGNDADADNRAGSGAPRPTPGDPRRAPADRQSHDILEELRNMTDQDIEEFLARELAQEDRRGRETRAQQPETRAQQPETRAQEVR